MKNTNDNNQINIFIPINTNVKLTAGLPAVAEQ